MHNSFHLGADACLGSSKLVLTFEFPRVHVAEMDYERHLQGTIAIDLLCQNKVCSLEASLFWFHD
jgi:hypothetical protein